jgi:myo-inositol-1(or 4)-monophosphatase
MAPDAPDWTAACRRAGKRIETLLADSPTTAERAREVGRGEGGDMTVAIDAAAEDAVFAELEALAAEGHRFTVLSEERGEVDFGGGEHLVVVDPIDGSLNAKRGLPHHALSIAVAEGRTAADIVFGFVHDFGPGEEWTAVRGEGARLDGVPLDPGVPERRDRDGRLEILAIESADPRWVAESIEDLHEAAHRLRAIGAIAISLCQVAATRVDGMCSLKRARAFDVAAALLVVREAGGVVGFPGADGLGGVPLDLEPRFPVVAARTPETLALLERIPKPPGS